MQLNLAQVKDITVGAVRILEKEDGLHFYRFTEEQETQYAANRPGIWDKGFAPSGIKLCFRTDSTKLTLAGTVHKATARTYYAIDIYKNGEKLGDIKNFEPAALQGLYTTSLWPADPFDATFDLGAGEKEVCVYLPWSMNAVLRKICLDDGAAITPVKRPKKLLCYGDSITQGYDARYPSGKYTTRLADILNADEYNKAIGGEIFQPWLAALKDDLTPDYITVAYGTNDWSACQKDVIVRNCTGFFANLAANYPNTPIFAITPVWRKDEDMERPSGTLDFIEKTIREATKDFQNITVIHGYDLIPHEENLYGDLRLHPNDEGFAYYAQNLAKKLQEII